MKDSEKYRRDFLKTAGIFAGSTLLAACASKLAGLDLIYTDEPAKLPEKQIKSANEETTAQKAVQEIPKLPEKPSFVYFSQKDPKWENIPNSGKGSMRKSGCGIATGAMVTNTDPYKYWSFCTDYYGPNLTLPELGWSFNFHRPVLESHDFTVEPLEGKLNAIKDKIKKFTADGIPVWINAVFYGIERGHNAEVIGINSDGDMIFNDPWYGEGVAIPDKFITPRKNGSWSMSAIIPPAH